VSPWASIKAEVLPPRSSARRRTRRPRAPIGRTARLGSLRRAAQALLDAWDGLADSDKAIAGVISGPVHHLRRILAFFAPADPAGPRPPRDTKQAQVLATVCRDEGASGPQIAEATGWAPLTVRGFLAALAKKGLKVDVLDRVRQVGREQSGREGQLLRLSRHPRAIIASWVTDPTGVRRLNH
jgi:hypothetical protein